ncbi:MAG: type II secretion system F family protein [Proteobacteria bacterium]|nr:type II secretion system F family protein [Pseudomonadota bacterium]MDA1186928.1 type II secretion system F family protein [Pseudomonadota bacterium]
MTELNLFGLLASGLAIGVGLLVYLAIDVFMRAKAFRSRCAIAGHKEGKPARPLLLRVKSLLNPRQWPQRLGRLFASRLQPNPLLLERMQLAGLRSFESEADWFGLRLLSSMAAGILGLVFHALLASDESSPILWGLVGSGLGYLYPSLWLKQRAQIEIQKARSGFPAFLDGLALSLEAGQSFAQAFAEASQRGFRSDPAPWRQRLLEFAAEIRSGVARSEAARRLQQRIPVNVVDQFTALVTAAESSGLSMARVLRAQSSQARRQFQLEIEERAMKAPVKLMGPLVMCIFPCTFVILLAPLAVRLSESLGVGA